MLFSLRLWFILRWPTLSYYSSLHFTSLHFTLFCWSVLDSFKSVAPLRDENSLRGEADQSVRLCLVWTDFTRPDVPCLLVDIPWKSLWWLGAVFRWVGVSCRGSLLRSCDCDVSCALGGCVGLPNRGHAAWLRPARDRMRSCTASFHSSCNYNRLD